MANRAIIVGMSHPLVEVGIWLLIPEATKLPEVLSLTSDNPALTLGKAANSPVHWAAGQEICIFLLIGQADVTSDICITLPRPFFEEIIRAVHDQLAESRD